jgi:hypothetical protein
MFRDKKPARLIFQYELDLQKVTLADFMTELIKLEYIKLTCGTTEKPFRYRELKKLDRETAEKIIDGLISIHGI